MFVHNLKYSLKTLFKNKMLIFWTFAFPIILGTLFKLAFSNIESNEKLDIINIAIVDNEEFNDNEMYKEAYETLSDENNEDRLFNTKYVTEEEAIDLLQKEEIEGYIIFDETPKIVVVSSGIDETVIKYVTEEITQSAKIAEEVVTLKVSEQIVQGNYNIDYDKLYKDVLDIVQGQEANIKDISRSNLSYTMIEFYTLIAMACLYSGMLGMVSMNQILPNVSNNGKRVAISPASKGKLVLSSVIASYITQIIGVAILFVYTIFVLKVDFGNNLGLVILLALIGSLAGLALGIFLSSVVKANENIKMGTLLTVTMFGCFLSGMMGITMKYIVDKNMPIINKINPASMITDGFYSLYYYDTLDRYYFNVISLLIFSAILVGISFISLRRQKYDSI